MKKILIMLAIATIPAASGCNCCGLGTTLASCPCNPCNWFSRGAYCGPTAPAYCPPAPTYTPVAAPCPTPCGPAVSTVMPQYPVPTAAPLAAPYAAAPYAAAPGIVGAPMIADPSAMGYAMPAQPMYYSEPGCGFVESSCGFAGAAAYGPSFPMDMGGCPGGACFQGGSYDGAVMTAPTEQYVDPMPTE